MTQALGKCLLLGLMLFSSTAAVASEIDQLCTEVGRKLGSVSVTDCKNQQLTFDGTFSHYNRPLAFKVFEPPADMTPKGKVLFMGGIHGDEYSAISIMFKWMEKLSQADAKAFHWKVVPLLNPDGLLQERRAQRQNGRGVDLNRNFPSSDWETLAHDYWINRTKRNARRFPGEKANSEIETKWFVQQIESFQPDVIIAVHAPHELVDYDGPDQGPEQLGGLQLRRLGTYPGSLGNYGGVDLNIPVITVELSSAGSMPSAAEIDQMWTDMMGWLNQNIQKKLQQAGNKATTVKASPNKLADNLPLPSTRQQLMEAPELNPN